MILQLLWVWMVAGSLLYGGCTQQAGFGLEAALAGCENAIALTLRLGAGYLFFCGWMEMVKAAGAAQGMERLLRPVLRRLMPYARSAEAREAITMNLTMNLLGVGNAATPLGMEAIRRMEEESGQTPGVRYDMYMLLILNATSIQLLPTTVLALRASAGSAQVNAVLLPTLLCTGASSLVGVTLGWLCQKWEGKRHGR